MQITQRQHWPIGDVADMHPLKCPVTKDSSRSLPSCLALMHHLHVCAWSQASRHPGSHQRCGTPFAPFNNVTQQRQCRPAPGRLTHKALANAAWSTWPSYAWTSCRRPQITFMPRKGSGPHSLASTSVELSGRVITHCSEPLPQVPCASDRIKLKVDWRNGGQSFMLLCWCRAMLDHRCEDRYLCDKLC